MTNTNNNGEEHDASQQILEKKTPLTARKNGEENIFL